VKLVVLDLLGTTVTDTGATQRALRDTLSEAGHVGAESLVSRFDGYDSQEIVRKVLTELNFPVDEIESRLGSLHASFVERTLEHFGAIDAQPIEGLLQVVTTLRDAGFKTTLASTLPRNVVDCILLSAGWFDIPLFDNTVACNEVAQARPAPDMIEMAMAFGGIERASDVCKVGDTPADLLEGHQAGCGMNVAVTTGSFTNEQLSSYPHTHIIDSIRDLPDIVLR